MFSTRIFPHEIPKSCTKLSIYHPGSFYRNMHKRQIKTKEKKKPICVLYDENGRQGLKLSCRILLPRNQANPTDTMTINMTVKLLYTEIQTQNHHEPDWMKEICTWLEENGIKPVPVKTYTMMMLWHRNNILITGPVWGESTRIPLTEGQ